MPYFDVKVRSLGSIITSLPTGEEIPNSILGYSVGFFSRRELFHGK
jgi:hypothetical protein